MSNQDNVRIYQRFVEEVLNQGKVETAKNYFAPDFVDHSLPPDMPATLEGFGGWFKMFRNAYPDAKWNIEFIIGVGDIVAHHKTFTGTHRGEYLGVPGTGRRVKAQETGIIRFREGKMAEYWGTMDDFGLARQLGLYSDEPEEGRVILQRVYDEVFTQGNLDMIDELVAPDAVEHEVVPGLEDATGPEALLEFTRMFRAAFPDLKATAEDWVSEGDKVVARFVLTGTHQGEFMGMPPTGKPIKISGIDIVRVENGKLIEHWGSSDNLGLMEQLGAIPEPV